MPTEERLRSTSEHRLKTHRARDGNQLTCCLYVPTILPFGSWGHSRARCLVICRVRAERLSHIHQIEGDKACAPVTRSGCRVDLNLFWNLRLIQREQYSLHRARIGCLGVVSQSSASPGSTERRCRTRRHAHNSQSHTALGPVPRLPSGSESVLPRVS